MKELVKVDVPNGYAPLERVSLIRIGKSWGLWGLKMYLFEAAHIGLNCSSS